ncbi:MAG: PIN domain-containing protein [Kiritimatiellae bacterium]|nr:PIN domain-containing protein [Kiritimatiellia bacterium]
MPKTVLLDTNVLIRYITNDDPLKADDCEQLFKRAVQGEYTLLITDICLAELVWTLDSFYRLERSAIAEKIIAILNTPGFSIQHEDRWIDALDRYTRTNVDFIDAYHASFAFDYEIAICS